MNFLKHLPLFTNGDICENALLRQTKIAHKINMLVTFKSCGIMIFGPLRSGY